MADPLDKIPSLQRVQEKQSLLLLVNCGWNPQSCWSPQREILSLQRSLCAVFSGFAQETRIWLQDTGKRKSSNAVTITYDRQVLLFLCLPLPLKVLLISLYTELESFRAVNFKPETQVRISQPYINILSMPTLLIHIISAAVSFLTH